VPTVLNLAQCVGWATFEIVIISETADRVIGGGWRWPIVLLSGGVATAMAIRPLAVVRAMKRYLVWLVTASVAYFFVEVVRQGLPPLVGHEAGWNGFWVAVDIVVALPVSWMPLAADYSRQSRSGRDAFLGSSLGYGGASIAFFVLGVLAVRSLATDDVIGALIALPAGALALAILAVDEVDEAFANIYSTAVSTQNLLPRLDRRVLAVAIGALATVLALVFDIVAYENFLFLIGSVFVPLYATLIVDYFVVRRRRWDTSAAAPARWVMAVPWVAGFVTYQLVNPGTVGWWQ
jgi:putative hydroxymethylpyrimidine transporter CytX